MSVLIRYGVFKLGQIWCVYGPSGERFGYMSRAEALSAANVMARARRAEGVACEVLVQADNGRLVTLAPSEALGLAG